MLQLGELASELLTPVWERRWGLQAVAKLLLELPVPKQALELKSWLVAERRKSREQGWQFLDLRMLWPQLEWLGWKVPVSLWHFRQLFHQPHTRDIGRFRAVGH